MKSNLNPISFEITIAENLGKFTGREWLIEKIDDWVNDPNGRRVYWILGNTRERDVIEDGAGVCTAAGEQKNLFNSFQTTALFL